MQPYFFPYVGYFQLIEAVDKFIIYDNIKYTKKGWINRNRLLQNGKDAIFTLPLKNDSDFLDVRDRELATNFSRKKLLDQIEAAYRRAPYFEQTFPLIQRIVRHEESNLFAFLRHSIARTCEHLKIATNITISSHVPVQHDLRSQERVIAMCEAVGADTYVNPIGGTELYDKDEFKVRGIELKFIKSLPFEYRQYGNQFVPWLSIIDVMMFNCLDVIRASLQSNYEFL